MKIFSSSIYLNLIFILIYFKLSIQSFQLDNILDIRGQQSINSTRTYSSKVIKSGYEFEEHKILTEDGHILTTWRIPRKIGENPLSSNKRKPILLQHGIIDDSWTWFTPKAEDCLPIVLVKEGYDVWLSNSRGNIFSYEHINPKYDSSQFYSDYWNFTFQEMAEFDLPANIEYIKSHTGFEKIDFIGHSQGTFMFFLSFLINPNYLQNNIDKFVSIGTVVTIFNIESPTIKFLSQSNIFNYLLKLHFNSFLDLGTSFPKYLHYFCSKFSFVCKIIINSIIELRVTNRVNYEEISDLYYYEPGGTSTKNLFHWIQIYETKKLACFDYGTFKNLEIYGEKYPPLYNIKNFEKWKIKTFLVLSDNDPFSTEKDVNFFLDSINNKTDLIYVKKLNNYNHLDYIWSSDAKLNLFVDILKFLKN